MLIGDNLYHCNQLLDKLGISGKLVDKSGLDETGLDETGLDETGVDETCINPLQEV